MGECHVHEAIATPLREERDCNDNPHTLPVSRGTNEIEPTSLSLNSLFLDGSANFLEFKANQCVIAVAIRMIIG